MRNLQSRIPQLLTFVGALVLAVPVVAQPPRAGFGFNGVVSGFPTGVVLYLYARRALVDALNCGVPAEARPPALGCVIPIRRPCRVCAGRAAPSLPEGLRELKSDGASG